MNCVLGGNYVISAPTGAVAQNGAAPGVTGTGAGAGANNGYTGDGHAVGVGSNPGTSMTLGNTNGATLAGSPVVLGAADTFLITDMSSSQFSFQFGNGFTIAAGSVISFDYQIFPNGDCTAMTSAACGGAMVGGHYPNEPDFKFQINGVQAGATQYGITPGTGGTYNDSPAAGAGLELVPQKIGVFSYTVGSALVNPLLTFVDWPATIGIDNLTLTTTTHVPEPLTLTLMGLGMVGLRTYRRRMAA
jgi:hypothetical protein